MSSVYTHEVFKKFQIEVLGLPCHTKKKEDGQVTSFRIKDFQKMKTLL